MGYSYVRFSHPDQAKGNSYARQKKEVAKFCERWDLTLSDKTYEDLGLSGWTGKNIDEGALGAFLEAVKKGKIEKGSVLIVEQLDRLTRIDPPEAIALFSRIIKSGVRIGHLRKGRILDKSCLKGFGMMEFVAELILANEESQKKSERVLAALATHQANAAKDGTIWTGKGPQWLQLSEDGKRWIKIPEQVKKVKLIFKHAKTMGVEAIAKQLVTDGVKPLNGKNWNRTALRNILRSRVCLGEYQPTTRHELDEDDDPIKLKNPKAVGKPIVGYYGKGIIDKATWRTVQNKIDSRSKHRGTKSGGPTGKFVNVLSGLVKDQKTGSTMYINNRPQRDGSVRRVLFPSSQVNGHGGYWSVNLSTVERAVLLAVKELTLENDNQSEEESELEGLQAKAETLTANLQELKETIGTKKDFTSGVEALMIMDADLKAAHADTERLQAALNEKPQDRLKAAKTAIKALEADNSKEVRLAVRGQLRGLIEKIEIKKTLTFWSKAKGLELSIIYKSQPTARVVVVDLKNQTYMSLRHDIEEGDDAIAVEDQVKPLW